MIPDSSDATSHENNRQKLLGNHTIVPQTSLDMSTLRLEAAQRAATEAEQVSIQVYDQLRQQREQLQRAAGTLQETDYEVRQSNRTLQEMIRRLDGVVVLFNLWCIV